MSGRLTKVGIVVGLMVAGGAILYWTNREGLDQAAPIQATDSSLQTIRSEVLGVIFQVPKDWKVDPLSERTLTVQSPVYNIWDDYDTGEAMINGAAFYLDQATTVSGLPYAWGAESLEDYVIFSESHDEGTYTPIEIGGEKAWLRTNSPLTPFAKQIFTSHDNTFYSFQLMGEDTEENRRILNDFINSLQFNQ